MVRSETGVFSRLHRVHGQAQCTHGSLGGMHRRPPKLAWGKTYINALISYLTLQLPSLPQPGMIGLKILLKIHVFDEQSAADISFLFKSFLTPYSLLKRSQWLLPLNHLVPVLTPLPSSTQYFIALHHTLFSLSPTSILSWRDGVLFVFLSPNASCRCSFSVPPKRIRKDSPLYPLNLFPRGPGR